MAGQNILSLLIIEDNPGDAIFLREYLSEIKNEISIVNAETFEEAKKYLSSTAFDAIFLDLSLPDHSGKELVTDIISLAEQASVIVLTGYSNEKFGIETLSLGVSDYLLKDELTVSQLSKSLNYGIERKRIERKLFQSNERYEILAKATSDTIWDWNISRKTIVANQGITRVFGYSEEEIIENEEWWHEKIHPDDYDRLVKTLFNNFIKGVPVFQIEYRFRCADGSYKYVLDRGYLLFDNNKKPARMIGAMQDITSKKEEEERLRLLQSVITNATDAILVTDANHESISKHKVIYVNEAFMKMTQYTTEEIIGASPLLFLESAYNAEELKKLEYSLETFQNCDLVLLNKKKSGAEYWANVSVAPVSDGKDGFTHWIYIQRDVSDRRLYLQSIEEQNKKLKEIAWTQSHAVRAPLARIMGLVNLLTEEENNFELSPKEIIANIASSALELDVIIRQIVEKTENVKIQGIK